jgi:hypothetical protein
MRQEDTKHNWINQIPRLEHGTHAKTNIKIQTTDLGGS